MLPSDIGLGDVYPFTYLSAGVNCNMPPLSAADEYSTTLQEKCMVYYVPPPLRLGHNAVTAVVCLSRESS